MITVKIVKLETEFRFDIDPSVRSVLLGENGIGKSTILRCIEDKTSENEWVSVVVPKNLHTRYFSQIEVQKEPLSGGEHTKRRLMELFSQKADLYILDEPTNNLDEENKSWLKQYIISKKIPIIFSSHDIDFVDSVAEVIFYLDSKGVEKSKEKCSAYLVSRKKKVESEFQKYEESLLKNKQLIAASQKSRRHAEEGSKWKGSDNDKFLRGFNRNSAGKSSSVARKLEERAEKVLLEKPKYDPIPKVQLSSNSLGGHFFSLVTKNQNGETIELSLSGGKKMLITGSNGVGKSTLVKYLVRLLEGGVPKEEDTFSQSKKISYLYISQDWYEHLDRVLIRTYLTSFGLSDQEMFKSISYNHINRTFINKSFGDLSPGLRIKLLLGVLSCKKYDLLIWDEPTNHLDVMSQSVLHEAIKKYSGAIIVVTHDQTYTADQLFTRVNI